MGWHGKQGRGAKALRRKEKRAEAEERNAATDPKNRRAYRRDPAVQLLTDLYANDRELRGY